MGQPLSARLGELISSLPVEQRGIVFSVPTNHSSPRRFQLIKGISHVDGDLERGFDLLTAGTKPSGETIHARSANWHAFLVHTRPIRITGLGIGKQGLEPTRAHAAKGVLDKKQPPCWWRTPAGQ